MVQYGEYLDYNNIYMIYGYQITKELFDYISAFHNIDIIYLIKNNITNTIGWTNKLGSFVLLFDSINRTFTIIKE
jgi:hypothetical protein